VGQRAGVILELTVVVEVEQVAAAPVVDQQTQVAVLEGVAHRAEMMKGSVNDSNRATASRIPMILTMRSRLRNIGQL
jgi:hypothetical protein